MTHAAASAELSHSGEVAVQLPSGPHIIPPKFLTPRETENLENLVKVVDRRLQSQDNAERGFADAMLTRGYEDTQGISDPTIIERIVSDSIGAIEAQTPHRTFEERRSLVIETVLGLQVASHERLNSAANHRLADSRAELAAAQRRVDMIAQFRKDQLPELLAIAGDNNEMRNALLDYSSRAALLDSTPLLGASELKVDLALGPIVPDESAFERAPALSFRERLRSFPAMARKLLGDKPGSTEQYAS